MKIVNKHIAVEAFKVEKKEQSQTRGLVSTNSTTALISTKAVFDSENYLEGSLMYFRADVLRLPQANVKLTAEGKEFILLPEDLVVGVEPIRLPPAIDGVETYK